jgi:hypothetical protein
MEQLILVTLEYQTKFFPGLWVIPSEGSGLNFHIGQIKETESEGLYSSVQTESGEIRAIYHKLQPIKLLLVRKESFQVGDWYYSPAIPKPKKPIKWKDYSARIGKIAKELDAKLFSLSNCFRVIYKSEQVSLTKSPYDNQTYSIGDVIPIDPWVTSRILKNEGKCWVEEFIEEKPVILYEEPGKSN